MMFGDGSFGEYAFGEIPPYTAPGASETFTSFLADISAQRCWLFEIDAFSLASVGGITSAFGDAAFGEISFGGESGALVAPNVTLRFSSDGYTSQPTDSPASTWYDSRLTNQIRVERRIIGKDGIGGMSSVAASVEMVNADGALDDLTKNYAIDGRPARLYLGRMTDARANFGQVFGGVVQSVTSNLGRMVLTLSDGAAKLNVPVQKTLYLGTGGLEGRADLAGKPKPKCWGQVFNISPPLVDSANLIYQVHDGVINDVPAVYDRGIALARVAGAPAAGQYQVTTANGTFQLGASPAGTVTCDVKGDASLTGYVDQTNFILLRVLFQQAGLTDSDIVPSSFAGLNTDAPAPVGIWIGTTITTVASVVDELLMGISAFGGFSRLGQFTVGIVKAPSAPVGAWYTQEDIFNLEVLPLPASIEPVVWRVSVGYQKNYTVQNDLAAGVPAARNIFASQQRRISKIDDASILARRLLAQDYGPVPGLYVNQSDSDAECSRLFGLWSNSPKPYRFTLPASALERDLGQTASFTHPRYGFVNGKLGRVIGHSINAQDAEVQLTVLA